MKFTDYLAREGYRPFHGAVATSVYESFHCPHPDKGRWLFRPGSFQCAGCREQCETDSPSGFQLFLGLEGFGTGGARENP